MVIAWSSHGTGFQGKEEAVGRLPGSVWVRVTLFIRIYTNWSSVDNVKVC